MGMQQAGVCQSTVRAAGAVNTAWSRRLTPMSRSCPAPVGAESAGLVGCRVDLSIGLFGSHPVSSWLFGVPSGLPVEDQRCRVQQFAYRRLPRNVTSYIEPDARGHPSSAPSSTTTPDGFGNGLATPRIVLLPDRSFRRLGIRRDATVCQ